MGTLSCPDRVINILVCRAGARFHRLLGVAERYDDTIMNHEIFQTLPQTDAEWLSACFPKEDWSLYFWGFTCFSRQDYAGIVPADGVDEIMLGIQCIEGGCLGELAIRWLMPDGKLSSRLETYDDAWPLLQTPTFAAVLEELTKLSRDHASTPDEVSALLIAHGFTDQSDRPLGTANG